MIVQKIFLENKYNKLEEYLKTNPSKEDAIKWLQKNNYRTVTVRSADTTSQIDRLAKYYADEMVKLVVENTNITKEQAEEEENADDNVTKFELFGSDKRSLYELDAEMKARAYTAPSLTL